MPFPVLDTTIKNSLICTIKYKATCFIASLICMRKYWEIYFKVYSYPPLGGWPGGCSKSGPELGFTLLLWCSGFDFMILALRNFFYCQFILWLYYNDWILYCMCFLIFFSAFIVFIRVVSLILIHFHYIK